ncbi:HpcH/HpaI aldolase/citrate lyase family protein [Paracoccus marinus]|uniref:HpcH/HpaI aldolase/citrate lyase family protein n=1 Tax=Paracoccus marinus TaxID=288426 RepID=UPI00103C2044|nr:CoA ester lyase [Paracoccus marinus]GLS80092.1 (3S)-malyl-CoA thioesterase [Paracoccus marinus]
MNQSRPCRSAPYRSALYLPASNARALDKARDLPADAIIFDLEDAVAPAEKAAARGALRDALARDYGNRARIVRINGFDSEWGRDDAAAFATGADAVLVPKVNGPADLDAVAAVVPGTPLWAMLETAAGVLNAAAIAAHPRLGGLVMGTNDLARELGCRDRADRLPLLPALGMCLLAARARGRVILDGVYNAFRDADGLRAECAQGRDMGFDGKTLIHPAQIDIANAVFAPTEDEIALSRRRIEAFDAALAEGWGIAVLDGRIVENLHVETARATLDRAAAIGALSG